MNSLQHPALKFQAEATALRLCYFKLMRDTYHHD